MKSDVNYTTDLQPIQIVRTETVLSRLPIHHLAKTQGGIDIAITQHNTQGEMDLRWEVSYNDRYGQPGQLAYKLDTLVVNRCIEMAGRPVPKVIRLGSMRDICAMLGHTASGRNTAHLKRALHQNAGAYITAFLRYKGRDGAQHRLETGFTRYSVFLTGQRLPNGVKADAVHLALNDPYLDVLKHAPVRPLDYAYLSVLTPAAQRLYELLSFQVFAALKHQRSVAHMRYSGYCTFAPQRRYLDYDQVKKQMYKLHTPHLRSGYLSHIEVEPVIDTKGNPDWLLQYTPGPKACDEHQILTQQGRKDSGSLRVVSETHERKKTLSARPSLQPPDPTPRDISTSPATALVQQFYRLVHRVADQTPHSKELEHAVRLVDQHGQDFAVFFVNFACKAARQDDYSVQVFGGLMKYEPLAIETYRRQKNQQDQASAETAQARELQLREQYERYCQSEVATYQAGLSPEQVATLTDQVRADLTASEEIPTFALPARLQAEIDEVLRVQAGVPSFEDWLNQRKEMSHG